MKIRIMIAAAMLVLVSGLVVAAETPAEKKTGLSPRQTTQERRAGVPAPVQNRDEMYKERMANQADNHAKAIKELTDLKKMAEEENATKTAAAIQAMIDAKNQAYKKQVEQIEKQRRERAEQVQKRMQERQTQENTDAQK